MECLDEFSNTVQQKEDDNAVDQSREISDTRDGPVQMASSPDRSTEPSILNSTDEDPILLPRFSTESVNVETRRLSSRDYNGEPSGLAPASGLSASGHLGISNFLSQSLPNLNEMSSTLGMENFSIQNPDENSFSSDSCVLGSYSITQSSVSDDLSDQESELLNLSSPRRIDINDSTNAAVIPPTNNTSVDELTETSQSSNQCSLESPQIPNHSESRRQSESDSSFLGQNHIEQLIRSDTYIVSNQDARSDEDEDSEYEDESSDDSGPLPDHWETGEEDSYFLFLPHPPTSEFKPSMHYWPRRRQFGCRNEFIAARSTSSVDRFIFSPCKEIIQATSVAESGNFYKETSVASDIDRVEVSSSHVMVLRNLRDILENMEFLYDREAAFRRDLLLHSRLLRDFLSESLIGFRRVYRSLPTTSSVYRDAAEILLSRALVRVSIQRRYLRNVSRRLRRSRRRNPRAQEDSYRDIRRLVLVMIEEITFFVNLAQVARDESYFG